ncbi:unnamed protein product [Peniophora sp. CBMAI 1063]|nr:unnamed protein product [Peniophora sp. CBMAI 1063]
MDSDDLQPVQGPTAGSIQDLLNSLRTSAAWAQVVGVASAADARDANNLVHTPGHESHEIGHPVSSTHTATPVILDSATSVGSPSPSVASLLSQLQASSANISVSTGPPAPALQRQLSDGHIPTTQEYGSMPDNLSSQGATPNQAQQKDFRTMSFQKSLTHVAALAEDEDFVQAMKSMKEEQDALERKLWEERTEILDRHEQKVKAAKSKAQIIGSGLSKLDADLLSDAIRREIQAFEVERALPAWDGLVAKHQAAMEVLTVPAMFVASNPADLQKQKKVMQLVEGTIYGDE